MKFRLYALSDVVVIYALSHAKWIVDVSILGKQKMRTDFSPHRSRMEMLVDCLEILQHMTNTNE